MSECFRCGVSQEKARLYDVVSKKGIIKLCENCNHIEHLQIVRRPSEEQILDSKNPMSKSVRDRLSEMNNKIKPSLHKEVSLRTLIDKDYNSKRAQAPADLIPNFHWAIQRIRRNRKITREEFAKGIGESEKTVRMIEQGYFPDSSYKIVNKIESYLGLSLRRSGSPFSAESSKKFVLDESLNEKVDETQVKEITFNKEETKKITIRDLLGLKKKQEDTKKTVIDENNDYPMDDEQFLDSEQEFDEKDI
jgi:ribosome-binding protein aMBF1 (putative translation factor)